MKRTITLMHLICLSLFASGCTHTVQFKLVDSQTGAPLSGVQTRWARISFHGFLRLDTRKVDLPATTDNGLVEVAGIKAPDSLSFRYQGYWPASVTVLNGNLLDVLSPDKLKNLDSYTATNNVPITKPVIIKMYAR